MGYVKLSSMPKPEKTYRLDFPKLDGGLNLEDLDYLLPTNQSAEMKNLWWEDGVLQCRDGQKYITTELKRRGYTCAPEPFWGSLFFHVGASLYRLQLSDGQLTEFQTPTLNENRGTFFRFGDYLMYKNAGGYYKIAYDATGTNPVFTISRVADDAYVPTIVINADPATGSGDMYQPENRLSAKKTVWYNVGSTKTYYATSDGGPDFIIPLAEGATLTSVVSVYSGANLIAPTGYTVDKAQRKITFTSAPASGTQMTFIVWVGAGEYKLPVSGDDVEVTHIEVDGTERPVFQWPERQPKPKTVSVSAKSGSEPWRYISSTGKETGCATLKAAYDEAMKDSGDGTIVLTENHKLVGADRQETGKVYFCRPTKNVTVDLGGHTLTDELTDDAEGLNLFHPECKKDITIRIQNGEIKKTTSRSIVAVGTSEMKATDTKGKINVILKDVIISYSGSSSLFTSYSPNTALAIDGCDLEVDDKSTKPTSAVSFIMSTKAGWSDEQQSPWSVLIRDSTIRAKNHIVYYETRNEEPGPQITLIGQNTFAYKDESCAGFKWKQVLPTMVDEGILETTEKAIGLLSKDTLTNYDVLSPLPEPTESEGYYSFATDDKGAGWLYKADSVVHIPDVRATVPPTNNTVRITYSKPNEDALKSILDCQYAHVFKSASDLCVLLGGSHEQPNAFFWSSNTDVAADPSYFPMSYYNLAGDTSDPVRGFGTQYSSYILFKEHQIGKLDFTTEDIDGRQSISFTYTILNSRYGCDLPWTIQTVENNLVWCNTYSGVHLLQAASAAYENNVLALSGHIDGNEQRHGLLYGLTKEDRDTVCAFDDNTRYWLCLGGNRHEAYLWDYRVSGPSKPSWFYFTNIDGIAFAKQKQTLYHLNAKGRMTEFTRSWRDYGEHAGIEKVYKFPPQFFGTYEALKDITDVIFSVRADTASNTTIDYSTDWENRKDQTNIVTRSWSLVPRNLTFRSLKPMPFAQMARRRPGCKHVHHFTMRLSNSIPGEDLAILSAQIFYRFTRRTR